MNWILILLIAQAHLMEGSSVPFFIGQIDLVGLHEGHNRRTFIRIPRIVSSLAGM
ncbi:MAG: hypothetical protein ACW98K_04765 [Candidatus Kariarchaeaceae archaeon]